MSDHNPLIYIIEDEEAIAKLISMYLEKSSIKTELFFNAESAVTALNDDRKPDLIILDLNLPSMSGFDFLNKLKEIYNKKNAFCNDFIRKRCG